ncbi:MAG: DegT/DnrJ/EryC1/StrS family aminotransferase [Bacteroidia bacterium]|nr:DegT/DnrJ/EryC1/StrS family aminotransferase [Bacteroidia bacterium]
MIPRVRVNYEIVDLLKSTRYIFERKNREKDKLLSTLRNIFSNQNVLLTPSGRGGLYFLLKAMNKSKVIIPSYTCSAVTEAALLAGKRVFYVDVYLDTLDMNLEQLSKIIDRDSVVIATYQYGFPCNILDILELCKNNHAYCIEDVAAGLFGKINNQYMGTFSDASFFSFDSSKLLNVPLKGGFVVVRDEELFNRFKDVYFSEVKRMPINLSVKNILKGIVYNLIKPRAMYNIFYFLFFTIKKRVSTEKEKVNKEKNEYYMYDMSDWQCYLINNQIKNLSLIIKKKKKNFQTFQTYLSESKSFDIFKVSCEEIVPVRFPILVKNIDKMTFYKLLIERRIDCSFSFTNIICNPESKNAIEVASRILNLPYYYKLSGLECKKIIHALKNIDEFLSK